MDEEKIMQKKKENPERKLCIMYTDVSLFLIDAQRAACIRFFKCLIITIDIPIEVSMSWARH